MTRTEWSTDRSASFRRWGVAVSIWCVAFVLWVPCFATASPPIPRYAQIVAKGQDGLGLSWSIWLFGHHKANRCWATKTVEAGSSSEDALCGFNVPKRPWQLAATATFGAAQNQKSVLFFLTRRSIVKLNVHVKKSRNHQAWIHLQTRRLSPEAAKDAQIDANFSYAVDTISGSLTCVGQVIAKTRSGKKILGSESKACSAREDREW